MCVCVCVCVYAHSVVCDSLPPLWTVARQASLSMGFSRQEYWSELPFPSSGDLPDPGIKSVSPALTAGFFVTESPGKPYEVDTLPILLMRKLRLSGVVTLSSTHSYGGRTFTAVVISLILKLLPVQGPRGLLKVRDFDLKESCGSYGKCEGQVAGHKGVLSHDLSQGLACSKWFTNISWKEELPIPVFLSGRGST